MEKRFWQIWDLDNVTFRIHVTKYSLADSNQICELIKQYSPRKVGIFKLHNLAKRKYEILGGFLYWRRSLRYSNQ